MLSARAAASRRWFSAVAQAKPRVLVIGSGWGGNKVARAVDKDKFDVRLISPANHFLFTPLLPSTAVGTLEFRCVQEPVRTIEGLAEYYQAKARAIDLEDRHVECEDIFTGAFFKVPYDFVVISAGCKTNTFNTPGVEESDDIFFLKHLYHARRIRNRVLECFERASSPMLSEAEKKSLVSFVIVGGGATSCEFTTELSDFVRDDVSRWYPELAKLAKLTVVEAGPRLMGSFDATVVEYYDKFLKARGVDVRTNTPVKAVEKSAVEGGSSVALLGADERLEFGCLVWSAGLAPVKFTSNSTNFIKGPGGRIVVDEYLRVVGPGGGVHSRAFALGDCAIDPAKPLPPTASAAEQQGSYLAEAFNSSYYAVGTDRATPLPTPPPIFPSAMPIGGLEVMNRLFTPTSHFRYIERGAMASMGRGCVII